MTTQELWHLFMETGAPEFYLMYNKARKMDFDHVLDDTGACVTSRNLQ